MTLHIDSDLIGIAGDWHGNKNWAVDQLNMLHTYGIQHIFQLGDFGIWGGVEGEEFINSIIETLKENDQILYVTLGNHEDYVRVNATPVASDGTQWYEGYSGIKLLPRGFRGTFGASQVQSWLSLGGANSIDYRSRVSGIDWWAEESITAADVYRATEGGKVDVMFCHDAPTGVAMPHEIGDESVKWHPVEIRYSQASRDMLRHAVDSIQPSVLFHGHHHVFQDVELLLGVVGGGKREEYEIRCIGLDRDTKEKSTIIYNVLTRTYTVVS